MISVCFFFQLVIVWFQTRMGATAVMAREILIVMTALKPGADAYRVANGEEQDAGALVTPEMELSKRERSEGVGVTTSLTRFTHSGHEGHRDVL